MRSEVGFHAVVSMDVWLLFTAWWPPREIVLPLQHTGVCLFFCVIQRPSRSFLFTFSSKNMGKDASERREQVRPVCEKTMSALRWHSTALSLCKQHWKCAEDVTWMSFIPHFFGINIPIICDGRHTAKLLVPVLGFYFSFHSSDWQTTKENKAGRFTSNQGDNCQADLISAGIKRK